jgi:uncharacterized membrane protein YeiH
MVVGNILLPSSVPVAAIGGVVCVALRLMAIRNGWKLPVAKKPD